MLTMDTTSLVDHSAGIGMLSQATAHVPNAKFQQVDMPTWDPSESSSYDLTFASHCCYNLSIAQTKSLVYKMWRWGALDSRNAKSDENVG